MLPEFASCAGPELPAAGPGRSETLSFEAGSLFRAHRMTVMASQAIRCYDSQISLPKTAPRKLWSRLPLLWGHRRQAPASESISGFGPHVMSSFVILDMEAIYGYVSRTTQAGAREEGDAGRQDREGTQRDTELGKRIKSQGEGKDV